MNSIKQLEYHQCRVCYDSTNNLQLLTSYAETDIDDHADARTYSQLLSEICNINVEDDKPLGQWPQFICFDCSNKLKLANDFIQQTHKINRFLKAVADILKTRNGVEFYQIPELDIPLEVKMEKDDDVEIVSNDREFQYSPSELEFKEQLTLSTDNLSFNHTLKEYNERYENVNACVKEIMIPSTIEFINDDLVIKDLTKSNNDQSSHTQSKKSNGSDKSLCNQCNKFFSNIWNLRRHLRFVHKLHEQKIFCPNIKKHRPNVHKMKTTKTTIRNTSAPIENLRKARNVGLFICNKCKKRYSNCQNLARHKRFAHASEEQKIPCSYCELKFGRSDLLKKHMARKHTKPISPLLEIKRARLSCDKCGRSYARSHNLLQHQKEVHGQ